MSIIAPRILLQGSLWKIIGGFISHNLFVNMAFKFPMYDVHELKSKTLGRSLPFPFSDGCNNKKGHLQYQLFMLL